MRMDRVLCVCAVLSACGGSRTGSSGKTVGARGPGSSKPSPEPGAPDVAQGFPLSAGRTWVYRGTAREGEDMRVEERPVNVEMRVLEVIERGGFRVAVMHGHPSDAVPFASGKTSQYIIVQDGARFFEVAQPPSAEKLRDPSFELRSLILGTAPFLQLPLKEDMRLCAEPEAPDADDPSYCWSVEGKQALDTKPIKGLPADLRATEWMLILRTRPDHTIMSFAPGVGITGYTYEHHGDIAEVDLRLVEVR